MRGRRIENPRSILGAAEGVADDLVGSGWVFVFGVGGLVVEGGLEDLVEGVEGGEVLVLSGGDEFFDAVVTGDEGGVGLLHERTIG